MKINLHNKHLYMNQDHEAYVIRKLEKLTHLSSLLQDESVIADVNVEKARSRSSGEHVEMRVSITIPHGILHAEVLDSNQITEAIDLIIEKYENYLIII